MMMKSGWMEEIQENRNMQHGCQSSTPLSRLSCLFLASLLGLVLWMTVAVAGENDSAKEHVMATVDQIMQILSDQQFKAPEQAQERRRLVTQSVNRLLDYEEMGKRTLGAQWKKLTVGEQEEFVLLFQQFLSNLYESQFEAYSDEQVKYLGERRKGEFAEVRTVLVSKKTKVPLDFRLFRKSGQWRVYDMVVDGVSLVKNFRSQFSRIIRASSFQGLLAKLKIKTELVLAR